MALLYLHAPENAGIYREALAAAFPHLRFETDPEALNPQDVRYMVTWAVPQNIARYSNLELLLATGAGADQFIAADLPPRTRIVRMVNGHLSGMMQQYVTLAVLALHRDLPHYVARQAQGEWMPVAPRMSQQICVGVMGLGQLGTAALSALKPFGFRLAGWSRTAHDLEGVSCHHGSDGLERFLSLSNILVCLLPLTVQTRGILDAGLFAKLPRGAALVHAGRGPQLNHKALLEALDSGHLRSAMLDVTDPEPLPAEHPLWRHPKVIITPHIATVSQPEAAVEHIIQAIASHERNEDPAGLVKRERGY